jgi:hypothetical protein
MRRVSGFWVLLCVAAAALAAGAAATWYTRPRAVLFLTDGDTIRRPAEGAPVREVLWQPAVPLHGAVHTTEPEYEPRFSEDGTTLYFVRGKAGGNADLYASTRTPDGWTDARPLTAINTSDDELGPCPSRDGRELYFYSNRPGGLGGYDLWVSHRGENDWLSPVNLGPAVNSPLNDYGPALAPDGRTLYFSSNRPRLGEAPHNSDAWRATLREELYQHDYDLYTAHVGPEGVGKAEPLEGLNTPADEGAPAVSPFGDFLYFSSDRPGGFGGFDVYRSRRSVGRLGPAENLGEAINSPAHDLDPALTLGGYGLCFSSNRERSGGPPGEQRDYTLFFSTSREVFREATTTRASIDWAGLLPWLWLLILLSLLALLLWLIARARKSDRFHRLSLLARCLLISLLIHSLVLLGLAFWQVGSAIEGLLRRSSGTRVALTSGRESDALATQVRGGLTDVVVAPAGAELLRAGPVERVPPTEAARFELPSVSAVPRAQIDGLSPEEDAPARVERLVRTADVPDITRVKVPAPDAASPTRAEEPTTAAGSFARVENTARPSPGTAPAATALIAPAPTQAPNTTENASVLAVTPDAPTRESTVPDPGTPIPPAASSPVRLSTPGTGMGGVVSESRVSVTPATAGPVVAHPAPTVGRSSAVEMLPAPSSLVAERILESRASDAVASSELPPVASAPADQPRAVALRVPAASALTARSRAEDREADEHAAVPLASAMAAGHPGIPTAVDSSAAAVTVEPQRSRLPESRRLPEVADASASRDVSPGPAPMRPWASDPPAVELVLSLPTGPTEHARVNEADGTLSGLVLDAATGAPIGGAVVRLDLPEGGSRVVRTGPEGAYLLRARDLPDNVAVSASRPGYTPDSANVSAADIAAGARHDFRLSPVVRSVVALESDPGVHHLGDDGYEGRINSQFQKRSEGLVYRAAFRLIAEQTPPRVARAEVVMLVKGAQAANEVWINGRRLDRRLDRSPEDGSFGEFRARFPPEWLVEGENTLSIRSVHGPVDYDDFEFVNVRVRLSRGLSQSTQ